MYLAKGLINKIHKHSFCEKIIVIDGITYFINRKERTACISDAYVGRSIFIPNQIKFKNKIYLVTSFSDRMNPMYSLTDIYFQSNSNIQIINKNLFIESKIVKIHIPASVKRICDHAFCQCFNLQEITFEKGSELQIIENSAFVFSSLQSIIISSKVAKLQEGWCKCAWRLNDVSINSENPNYLKYENKFIIGKNHEKYDTFTFSPRNITKVTIPSFIREIGSFSFCVSQLKNILIPSSVKIINKRAFANCTKLKKIEFQKDSQLEIIGDEAFFNSSIKCISIPLTVNLIGSYAFSKINSLQNVFFSDNSHLKIIGKHAFSDTSLKCISIPSSVEEIGDFAFSMCNNLSIVEFNSNVFSSLKFIFDNSLNAQIMIPKCIAKYANSY